MMRRAPFDRSGGGKGDSVDAAQDAEEELDELRPGREPAGITRNHVLDAHHLFPPRFELYNEGPVGGRLNSPRELRLHAWPQTIGNQVPNP